MKNRVSTSRLSISAGSNHNIFSRLEEQTERIMWNRASTVDLPGKGNGLAYPKKCSEASLAKGLSRKVVIQLLLVNHFRDPCSSTVLHPFLPHLISPKKTVWDTEKHLYMWWWVQLLALSVIKSFWTRIMQNLDPNRLLFNAPNRSLRNEGWNVYILKRFNHTKVKFNGHDRWF